MATRITSLAVLFAAGLGLAACQEEDTATEETSAVTEQVEEVEIEVEEEVAEAEATVEDEMAEAEATVEDEMAEAEAAVENEMAEAEAAVEDEMAEPADAETGDMNDASSGAMSEPDQAAELESTAAEDTAAAETPEDLVVSAEAESEAAIDDLLTPEGFDQEQIVTYIENSDLDETERETLIQAVNEVDPGNQVAIDELIERLQIAFDM